ncbi:TPA: hypothetical protein ACY38O_000762 [Pasteurella multocida]
MKKLVLVGLVSALLGGCAMEPKNVSISEEFDYKAAQNQMEQGKEKLFGSAFLRQNGGVVVTCAGATVTLYPYTKYTEARLLHKYVLNGRINSNYRELTTFTPDIKEFNSLTKTTNCDAQGNFEFNSIKAGRYFVLTNVEWIVPSAYGPLFEGGYIYKDITVNKGENKIVLTR